jgi:hypothetical protein
MTHTRNSWSSYTGTVHVYVHLYSWTCMHIKIHSIVCLLFCSSKFYLFKNYLFIYFVVYSIVCLLFWMCVHIRACVYAYMYVYVYNCHKPLYFLLHVSRVYARIYVYVVMFICLYACVCKCTIYNNTPFPFWITCFLAFANTHAGFPCRRTHMQAFIVHFAAASNTNAHT